MKDIIIASIIDLILGDPYSFPHPVKLMGRIISFEEKIVRKITNSKKGLKVLGLVIVSINISLGFFIPYLILRYLKNHKLLHSILNIYLIYTCIAARSLHHEAIKVKEALSKGLDEGRHRLSYIVGRDTKNLSQEEVIKATIETVSENTSDGVIAPLFYIFLLGAPGGLAYKFVNTMDSMLGYMNEKYKDLGYFPAIIDDIFNYIPARITALLMCISTIGKFNIKEGFKILKRDRRNHKSPNAGYPEAATAGLLGIQLGGSHIYNGLMVEKPTIGNNESKVYKNHINRTIDIMYRSEILFILLYCIINILK
ncbi:adenosylcobinamide-phosphate synthase CbiB [Wansuia hejianensis]|uniref:Cobalamin biosynthesis protein CobD n=1 Tax=Wansuia hejianensis TaxID=2763667 RepID=A0A926II66_9FIRM|nr:adenosylcobinamide-phosphate synthase CbiB [Wansuia hejianensis]MBC8591417.1 cobalamin biosynthesis protein CobD [Wansuia hejianensis]